MSGNIPTTDNYDRGILIDYYRHSPYCLLREPFSERLMVPFPLSDLISLFSRAVAEREDKRR